MAPQRKYKTHQVLPVFDERTCADIVKYCFQSHRQFAQKVDVTDQDGLMRQDILDLGEAHFQWLYGRLWPFVERVNKLWGFELTGWHQPLRIARYGVGYAHDWHVDYVPTDASKLAFSIPLNDSFKGGNFEMLSVPRFAVNKGHGVFFPAFHGHRVTPVTSGERYVLLGWVTGPRFT